MTLRGCLTIKTLSRIVLFIYIYGRRQPLICLGLLATISFAILEIIIAVDATGKVTPAKCLFAPVLRLPKYHGN